MTAKGIALARGLPLIAVNHLEGHALTARLTDSAAFPYLLLLVSGGHSQLLVVEGVGQYHRLGTTIDDAVGEAFDKTAKLLGLPYPGGPAVEQEAKKGDPARFTLPRPLIGKPGCDFSFSGLKTAVRQLALAQGKPGDLDAQTRADIAAAFQNAVSDVIADRVTNAIAMAEDKLGKKLERLVVAGGVAANQALKARLMAVADAHRLNLIVPPPRLCTDNGAMIAWAGAEKYALDQTSDLNVSPLARWPLDPSKPARGN
jgi:N6-L-threonylcarbamoyladenine synthase